MKIIKTIIQPFQSPESMRPVEISCTLVNKYIMDGWSLVHVFSQSNTSVGYVMEKHDETNQTASEVATFFK